MFKPIPVRAPFERSQLEGSATARQDPGAGRTAGRKAQRPRIVIVGGGPAGAATAHAMRNAAAEVLVVERCKERCVALEGGGFELVARAPGLGQWPASTSAAAQRNLALLHAEVRAVDAIGGCIRLVGAADENTAVAFDYLVVAVGAPGQSGRGPYITSDASLLTRFDRPETIEARIRWAAEQAAATSAPFERTRLLTFAVIGGGRTGVEVAATVAQLSRRLKDSGAPAIKVILFEAAAQILGEADCASRRFSIRCLEQLGVTICAYSEVTWVDQYGLAVGDARLCAATVFWAGKTPARRIIQDACWRTDRLGRAKVGRSLQVLGLSGVFVIGDAAAIEEPDKPPSRPQDAAAQQGRHVGEFIARRLAGASAAEPLVDRSHERRTRMNETTSTDGGALDDAPFATAAPTRASRVPQQPEGGHCR